MFWSFCHQVAVPKTGFFWLELIWLKVILATPKRKPFYGCESESVFSSSFIQNHSRTASWQTALTSSTATASLKPSSSAALSVPPTLPPELYLFKLVFEIRWWKTLHLIVRPGKMEPWAGPQKGRPLLVSKIYLRQRHCNSGKSAHIRVQKMALWVPERKFGDHF